MHLNILFSRRLPVNIITLSDGKNLTLDTSEYGGNLSQAIKKIEEFILKNRVHISNIDSHPVFEDLLVNNSPPIMIRDRTINIDILLGFCDLSAHVQHSFLKRSSDPGSESDESDDALLRGRTAPASP